ncbi:hypothetical protein GGTG_02210 [Gaeumannomyces tritici R3-111a-1]|uniref:Uncharacterized protein n=1 Tax=Gaeumannomyces tritici (strain R3-111a-1) TaxID=644352 RepID=J3NLR0_GAET3|nr:hypothetical protein GGTG_02210 [Gaeumannomyces tritici R3-111a-1]EJT82236.1 hypothetical protein GGTG_02210 [Gaeumannomyces tritici R3-111a-1]
MQLGHQGDPAIKALVGGPGGAPPGTSDKVMGQHGDHLSTMNESSCCEAPRTGSGRPNQTIGVTTGAAG